MLESVRGYEMKNEIDQLLKFIAIFATTLVALVLIVKYFEYQQAKLKVIEKQGTQVLQELVDKNK